MSELETSLCISPYQLLFLFSLPPSWQLIYQRSLRMWLGNAGRNWNRFPVKSCSRSVPGNNNVTLKQASSFASHLLKVTARLFCCQVGLHDILHATVMRISSVKTVLWLAKNLHQLFSNDTPFNTQSRISLTNYANRAQNRRWIACDSEREIYSCVFSNHQFVFFTGISVKTYVIVWTVSYSHTVCPSKVNSWFWI